MEYTYIKNSIPGSYLVFEAEEEPLSEVYYDLGTTWQDYLNGKFVPLSAEQVAFHEEHPEATVQEVWNMEITPRTLEEAKTEKLNQIKVYDGSDNVNAFIVSVSQGEGEDPITFEGWFTPTERSNYRNSIDAAKILNISTLSFYVGSTELTVPTSTAEQMLAMVQVYADQCYMVTRSHESDVEALETVEAVDNYDVTIGYPAKLTFNV